MTPALLLIAFVTLAAAAVAMALRNLIHSALLLIASWAGLAALYLWSGAQFVAFAQILVYVGAISMVVLFAVLLTKQGGDLGPIEPASLSRAVLALIAAGGVAGVLLGAILGTPLDTTAAAAPATLSVRQLGEQLMGKHAVSLLITGLILTVALLGAVVIAAQDKEDAS
ncbi:NADH-quinone oxidoreductase subunit J [Oleiharenicola sp. Vm1]|uniref:NADH-quinone oxidoreductase subunit J family protein n=1 Tax=Oleiharenicola sp. Vm1 TaxID=3398393 RepID=UPI0039F54BFB